MPEWLMVFITSITLIFMLIGLFGLMIPIFPGLVVMWLATLVYGFVTGFETAGWVFFGLITLLMLVGSVVDNIMMGKKAHDGGASWISVAVGLISGILGSLFLSPLGGLVTAPLGLFLAEFVRLRDQHRAFQATRAMLIGFGWAFVIRFGIGLVMITLWAAWAISNN